MNDLMSNIKNLREITGAGFLDCKKALNENNNDIDKSINFLRKKGLAKAIKKSSREANEGVIGVFSNNSTSIFVSSIRFVVFSIFSKISDITENSIRFFL